MRYFAKSILVLLCFSTLALAAGTAYHHQTGTVTRGGPEVDNMSSVTYIPAEYKFIAIRQTDIRFYVFNAATFSTVVSFDQGDCGGDLESVITVDPYNERGFGDVLMVHDELSHSMCEYSVWGVIHGNGDCTGPRAPNACCIEAGTGHCREKIRSWDLDSFLDTIDANNEGILFIPGDPACTGTKHGGCFVYNLKQRGEDGRTLERFKIDSSYVITKVGSLFTVDSVCDWGNGGDVADLQYDFKNDRVYVVNDDQNRVCILNKAMDTQIAVFDFPIGDDLEGFSFGNGKVIYVDDTGTNGSLLYASDSYCGDASISSAETCDDGNQTASDGCSATCEVEEGWTCRGLPSQCTVGVCDNDVVEGDEECDGGDFRGFTCNDYGYDAGELHCVDCIRATYDCWNL